MRFLKKKNTRHMLADQAWEKRVEEADVVVNVSDPMIKKQMKMIDFDIYCLKLIKVLQHLIKEHVDDITDSFYASILSIPELRQFVEKHSTVERLKVTLRTYIIEMFSGSIDDTYVDRRKKVANVHFLIQLEPMWYMAALHNIQKSLTNLVFEHVHERKYIHLFVDAIQKLINFEMQLVLDEYEDVIMKDKQKKYEEIKETVKSQISAVSAEVAALSEETSASVEQLIASSLEVNNSVKNSTEKSKKTKAAAIDGQKRMQELKNQIQSITTSTTHMRNIILKLNDSSEQIKKVVSIVQDIAEQTNLLALNSAIEAARAGEYGKGFAVVADEVRKLADETKKSVAEISTLMNHSNEYTSEVVSSINEVQQLVVQGDAESDHTNESFQHISSLINESLLDIEMVEEKMNELVQVIKEIGDATEKVSATAEQLDDTVKNM